MAATTHKVEKKVFPAILVLFALLIGLYAIGAYGLSDMGPKSFAKFKEGMALGNLWHLMLVIHAVFGGMALLLGWTQFVRRWRERYRNFHRSIGRIYLFSVMLAGISGLYLAVYATGGLAAQLGFGLLSLTWLVSGAMSLITIMRGDAEAHERWAFRSYAITLASVTLRLDMAVGAVLFGQQNLLYYYPAIAWLCWVPNVIVIEVFLRNRDRVRSEVERA